MTENPQPETDLAAEFRNLAQNLKNLLQASLQSEETQKLKKEIKSGLKELGRAADEAVSDFKTSETGQRIKEEAKDLHERVKSGEFEAKAREEISNAIGTLNTELEKALGSWFKPKDETTPEQDQEN